ncbi:MAG: GWxTD domain-containing protein [Bryobacteraceae bacterium]|jgi:GWxTD domain-containing protein
MSAKGLWVSSIGLTLLLVVAPIIAQQVAPAPAAAPAATATPAPAASGQTAPPDTTPAPAAAKKPGKKKAAVPANRETVAKPLTEKERKKKEAALKKELETPWKKWLNEDVAYIITDEERKAFKQFATDEEREQFVEQFWLRRDPTPDTIENEFKEEHYRRIAYANEHYASGIPGWKTDRGRIYITFGPPDDIESHPSGGTYDRPMAEGGGETSTYPFEDWRYRYIEGIGNDVIIEFVDTTMTGEYHMTMDPSEKDALLYVPNAGLTLAEQLGLSSKTARFQRTDGTHMGAALGGTPASYNEFTRLETFAKLQHPPPVKYKDLEAQVNTRVTFNVLPMVARVDYVRITDTSVFTLVTVEFENKDLEFQAKNGVEKADIHIFGRVTSMTRRPITTFERDLEINEPPELLEQAKKQQSIYQESVVLVPNRYRLNVVVKDTIGGNVNNYEVALDVPHFDDEKLASSSLILADQIQPLPTKSIGGGMFTIGDSKVRPKLNAKFNRDDKMGIYLQVYNFQPDEKTQKPSGDIQYEISKVGATDKVLDFTEDLSKIPNASANQVTIEKLLPLKNMTPGTYTLKITAVDKRGNQTLKVPSANFTVN